MRAGRPIIGLLGVLLASCGEDPQLTCTNGYVIDGERCVFRDFATGDYDAGVPLDASVEGPADASPCDASATDDAASETDASPCSAADAAADADPGE
jgi:hypothetical protein